MQRVSHIDTRKEFILDLGGEDGNAFALMGITSKWLKQMGEDPNPVIADMMSDDYDHLLHVMCSKVGQFIFFDNVPEQYVDTLDNARDAFGKRIEFEEGYE